MVATFPVPRGAQLARMPENQRGGCAAMLLRVLLAVLIGGVSGPVMAQDVDCETTSVQVELTFCAEADWNRADADLNEAYQAVRTLMRNVDADLPNDQQGAEENLRIGQRAWIAFRDGTCAAEGYLMHGGSAEPMVIYGCRARLTWARSMDLWAMVEGN